MESAPEQQPPKLKKVYPRKLTDKRREQNRQAQKVYREKQKKKIEELEKKIEEVTASASAPASSRSGNSAVTPESPLEPDVLSLPTTSGPTFVPNTAAGLGGYLGDPATTFAELDLAFRDVPDFSFSDDQFAVNPDPAAAASLSLPHRPPATTASWSTSDLTSATTMGAPLASDIWQTPFPSDEVYPMAAGEAFPEATDDAIEEIAPSDNILMSSSSSAVGPNPVYEVDPAFLQNHLNLSTEKSLSAFFEIASLLGITRNSYVNDHQSPFYDPDILSGTCAPPLTMARFHREGYSYLKPDLRPSTTQVSYPHFSYIDCFIWPKFRERVLKASVEGKIDSMELFVDCISDGVVCWGNTNRKKGAGTGVPWDQRSWEARPWFLKKWAWLIEDEDDDIVRGSRWWRAMRGESQDSG